MPRHSLRRARPRRSPGLRPALPREPLRRDALEDDRTLPRRPHGRRLGRPRQHERLLHGAEQRRCLEDDGRGPHVGSHLRRPADGLDRCARRVVVEAGARLGRLRRRPPAAGPLRRERDVPLRRRREDMDAPRPRRRAADCRDRGPPEGRRPRVRRGPRPPIRPERDARDLPDEGCGQDVGAGPLPGRGHRRGGRRAGPEEPGHRLCRPLVGAAGAVGERGVGGPRNGTLQVERRRDDLAPDWEGPPRIRGGRRAHRLRDRALRRRADLRDGRRAPSRRSPRVASSSRTTRARRSRR